MGLDMYLVAKVYVSGYEHAKTEDRQQYEDVLAAVALEGVASKESPHLIVEVNVAYWRKANQVHRWFVENVQDNVDDCGEYAVSREQLEELRTVCTGLLGNKDTHEASRVLPSQEGFFFGSTDYDEWYWADVESTAKQLDQVLSADLPGHPWFEYHSSW